MFNVTNNITINCPRFDVAEFSANPDTYSQWYGGIHQVEWKTSRPLIVGSKIGFITRVLGIPVPFLCEVLEYVPGYHLVLNETGTSFTLQTILSWEENAEGQTIVTLQNNGGFPTLPKPLARLLETIVGGAFLRASIHNLAALKKAMERKECKVN